MESPVGARTVIDGREVDYFSGSGYLGLQSHPAVWLAASNALQRYGFSTATSRGGYGEHPLYDELEKEACAFFAAQKILYFPSGYMGVSILTQSAAAPQDHYFIDSAAHFSLWDAAYLTNKPITPFRHCCPDRLAECLHRELLPGERPIVLSDGIFPISGEIAPLPAYLELVAPYQGLIYLDDAHAWGVLGHSGRGTPEYYNIQNENCRTSGTLNKALGGYGGVIFGNTGWIDNLERNSRICVGASPPPLPVAAASAAALSVARKTPSLRHSLWANVARARAGFRNLGWALEDTPSPILCLPGRDGINLPQIRKGLFEQNIAIELIHSYTSTPPGGALRIAIFSTHTDEQIDRLLTAFRRWV
jgi:8-amino-7-oxononanoate synthase